jgi:hypothetical protein
LVRRERANDVVYGNLNADRADRPTSRSLLERQGVDQGVVPSTGCDDVGALLAAYDVEADAVLEVVVLARKKRMDDDRRGDVEYADELQSLPDFFDECGDTESEAGRRLLDSRCEGVDIGI